MMAIRLSVSVVLGLIMTVALFYIMQALISGGRSAMTKNRSVNLVNFVQVKQKMHVKTKQTKPKQPPPPAQPPPKVKPSFSPQSTNKVAYSMKTPPDTNVKPSISSSGFSVSDGNYLPIVKVQPMYPQRALSRGLSGWVIVKFTVTSQGTVKNPVVVKNCAWIRPPKQKGECHNSPNSVFDGAAVRAAKKFKYKPRVVNGNPVDTAGVENKIKFKLVNGNG